MAAERMHKPVRLVLCWHMHQPYYHDDQRGEYYLPWVWLHAMKDHTDMPWNLERHPEMRVVVNLTPVLLEQLLDYADRIGEFLDAGKPVNDRRLNLLAGAHPDPGDPAERYRIIRQCQRRNANPMIASCPDCRRLPDLSAPITNSKKGKRAGTSMRRPILTMPVSTTCWSGTTCAGWATRTGSVMM